jgi:hypothetical protein
MSVSPCATPLSAAGPAPEVEAFDAFALASGATLKPGGSFLAFDRLFLNGIYVGGL